MLVKKTVSGVLFIAFFSSCAIFSPRNSNKIPPKTTNAVIVTPKDTKADSLKIATDNSRKVKEDSAKTTSTKFYKKIPFDSTRPARIAVLIPLYLDSAFNGFSYNLGKSNIPRFYMSGLEFYDGVMMAVDSLQKENVPVEVWIYDTRKQGESMESLVREMQALKFTMIIASIGNTNEQKVLADFASNSNIPLISATYPNDAYLNTNPFFIMVNPTWKTHVEAVYQYAVQNYARSHMVFMTKRGSLEDKIYSYFKELNTKNNSRLDFSTVVLSDNFSYEDVVSHLDSTKQNTVICGTLSERFGKELISDLNEATSYSTVAIGTPTWQGMPGTTGSGCSNIQLVLTTPYNYQPTNYRLSNISTNYKEKFNAVPGDMAFKGFETMYYFTKLLTQNKADFLNRLSDPAFKVLSEYQFEPVMNESGSFMPDYFENKKIYFVKVVNGEVQSIY